MRSHRRQFAVQRVRIDSTEHSFRQTQEITFHFKIDINAPVFQRPALHNKTIDSDIGAGVVSGIAVEREIARRNTALLELFRRGSRACHFYRTEAVLVMDLQKIALFGLKGHG